MQMPAVAPEFAASSFHPIYQRFFALESDPEPLLAYRAGEVPYWGLIRLPLLIRLADRVRGEDSAGDIFLKRRRFAPGRVAKYVSASLWRSPLRQAPAAAVFVCAGVNWARENSAYFNTRVDYFVRQLPDWRVLVVEGADNLRYAWPRAVAPVAFKGGLTVPVALRARLVRLARAEEASLRDFMALLARAFEGVLTRTDLAAFEAQLRYRIAGSRAAYALAAKFLDRMRPRIVFVESAHFGFDLELLAAAKERDIRTAELQHGAINPVCPHHNYHPRLLGAGFHRFLPDYFLSYGDFWSQLLTSSARPVTIGNPHIATAAARLPAGTPRPGSVYFLSSANSAPIYMERMRELVAHGLTVLFRPHPVERPLLQQRYGNLFAERGIQVDLGNDFYSQLRNHQFVIGDGRSTSLFEAFAIARGRVFILEMSPQHTAALPNHPFPEVIRSVRELKDRPPASEADEAIVERLFASDWERRFGAFMADVCGA